MRQVHENLSETHILGANTRQRVVKVDTHDSRPSMAGHPVCAALAQYQIAHVGVVEARSPFRIVRRKQSGIYFMACFEGRGRVLVDGRWQICKEGYASLLPLHIMNAFEAVPGSSWKFCWVRYQQRPEQKPISSASSPVLARFDSLPLRNAILGLYHECLGEFAANVQYHWVELIQSYALRFAHPWHVDDRLWHVWEKTASNLERPWTVEILAREAHMSGEHLRRLCRMELGRSPMQHVTYLRMRHASNLLSTTLEKVQTIAGAVGYQNPFVFSTTFKKWIGMRPSEYRKHSAQSGKMVA